MSYYKSENSEERIVEAIQILRREIAKEYCRKENGNQKYRNNREQLKAQIIPTLKVKLNLKDKIFHPSQRRYELAQLARKKDEIRQKNEDLISANPRVQLSETIRDSLAQFNPTEAPVTVFAIEQLLQEPDRLKVPDYADLHGLSARLDKINVGIRKLEERYIPSAKDFQARRVNILEQFQTGCNKCIYTGDIVTKATAYFGENSQAVATLSGIHNGIVGEMTSASEQVQALRSEVLEELENCGIETGLDTGFQTFWKGLKEKTKSLFNRVFNRNKSEALSEGINAQTENGDKSTVRTRKENFFTELQDFSPVVNETTRVSAARGEEPVKKDAVDSIGYEEK